MEAVVTALGEQHAELDALVAPLDARDWARPVPACPGWSVADAVLHVAQVDELLMAGVEEGHAAAAARMAGRPPSPGETIDDTVEHMVVRERGMPPAELLARWRTTSSSLRGFLLARDPRDPLPWILSDIPARTMATTRLTETWIHTDDVAAALGTTTTPGDRLWHVARLAWRTLPHAFTRAGRPALSPDEVRLELVAPSGAGWAFGPEGAPTVVTGAALEFCLVAARRVDPSATSLTVTGPDGDAVLGLVRTWA